MKAKKPFRKMSLNKTSVANLNLGFVYGGTDIAVVVNTVVAVEHTREATCPVCTDVTCRKSVCLYCPYKTEGDYTCGGCTTGCPN